MQTQPQMPETAVTHSAIAVEQELAFQIGRCACTHTGDVKAMQYAEE